MYFLRTYEVQGLAKTFCGRNDQNSFFLLDNIW